MSNRSNSYADKSSLNSNDRIFDYIILEKLGFGSYATVYKACKARDMESIVAIKCFERSKLSQPESMDIIINEIRMLKMLKHPNIVHMSEFLWDERNYSLSDKNLVLRVFAFRYQMAKQKLRHHCSWRCLHFISTWFVYIVEEYCDGGDLSKYIKKRQKIPEKVLQIFLKQIAHGLMYLRSFNICHLDLKPSNLLIITKPNIQLRIGDFGLSQFLSNETYQGALRGSPLYMAPEMLLRRHYDAKVDLWSVGIIVYECLFGKAPFASCTFKELRDKLIAEAPVEIPEKNGLSRPCQELLKRLLKYNPDERIDYDQFFAHPFVDIAHEPSPKTYSYAVDLIHQAVKHDANKEYKLAFNTYCDALAYLVPHVQVEKDPARKEALTARLMQYMDRTEAIRSATKLHEDQNSESDQSPVLDKMCASTPALVNALEIVKHGDLLLADGHYETAIEKYQIGLEMLIDLIPNEPPGPRKDLLMHKVNEWIAQATRAKALCEILEIQNPSELASEVKESCVVQ